MSIHIIIPNSLHSTLKMNNRPFLLFKVLQYKILHLPQPLLFPRLFRAGYQFHRLYLNTSFSTERLTSDLRKTESKLNSKVEIVVSIFDVTGFLIRIPIPSTNNKILNICRHKMYQLLSKLSEFLISKSNMKTHFGFEYLKLENL